MEIWFNGRVKQIGLSIITVASLFLLSFNEAKADELIVQNTSSLYTYDELLEDVAALSEKYSDFISYDFIGQSVQGRYIPVIVLGNADAPHKIMIQSSIHAREYLTAQMTMIITEYMACNYALGNNLDVYQNTCFYIVPMTNPDGVTIAQTTNANWKSNANGVDLNRQFNVGWETLNTKGVTSPGSQYFKGYAPETEPEVIALETLALGADFDCYISYHQKGNLIYYDDIGTTDAVSASSTALAKIISSGNGYSLVNMKCSNKTGATTLGGFGDWAQLILQKPSVCVECGSAYYSVNQLNAMVRSNKDTWAMVARSYYL